MRLPLSNLFLSSPLGIIEDQMKAVIRCAEAVEPLLEALIDGNQEVVQAQARAVSQLEASADDMKNAVRSRMPTRLFLPVARRDALRLVRQIDSIADSAEDVGVLLTLRPMDVPDAMQAPLRLMFKRVLEAVVLAGELVASLDSLMAAGFRGKSAKKAESLIGQIAQKEHDADKVQDQLARLVFELEHEMSPVAVFMWLKIIKEMGDMANHAENVGDMFRLFLAS